MSTYRLPDGTSTLNQTLFLKRWKAVTKRAEYLFHGYTVTSLNPGVCLVKYRINGLNERVVCDRIRLSIEALNTLSARLDLPPVG